MGSTKRTRFVISISVLFAFVGSLFIPSSINSLDKISYKQKDMINIGKGGIFIVTDSAFCSFDYKYIYNFSIDPTEKVRVLRETPGEYKVYGTTEFLPFTIHPSDKKELLYYLQSPSASYIPVTPINYDPINLVKTIPEVVQNVLLRPYPWDPGSPLKWFAILNNLLLLSFMIIGVWKQRKLPERVKMMRHYLLLSIICLLLMIGWTIPILGAIVRYKMIAELFILIIVFISLKPLRYAKK